LGIAWSTLFKLEKGMRSSNAVAQPPHAAIREMNKVHAPDRPAMSSISTHAPQLRRAVADARYAALTSAQTSGQNP